MSRRPHNPSRRIGDNRVSPFADSIKSKTHSSPYLSVGLFVGAFLLIGFLYRGQGGFSIKGAVSRIEGNFSCTLEVQRAIPLLRKAYGDSTRKVLHVGPDTCSVASKLLKEKDTEAFGVKPYDVEDADHNCKSLVHGGIVRLADIKFPLPYRAKSFPLVIVSDVLDYLPLRFLNKTLPDLARVSGDGLVVFTGHPRQKRAKATNKSKFGRPLDVGLSIRVCVRFVLLMKYLPKESFKATLRRSTWWSKYFVETRLEENEAASKKFNRAATGRSYYPGCQFFHLKSHH